MKIFLIILNFILHFSFNSLASPEQDNSVFQMKQESDPKNTFSAFEKGMNEKDVKNFANYFGKKTYISFFDGTNSSFSADQSFNILKKFLQQYNPSAVKLSNIRTKDDLSYATGTIKIKVNGKASEASLYLCLKKYGTKWMISIITIN